MSSYGQVKGKEEARALAWAGLVLELASQRRREPLRDGESQAGRGERGAACPRRSAEGLEQRFLRRGVNARPCVLDREFHVTGVTIGGADRDRPRTGELERVGHEVQEDAVQLDRMPQPAVDVGPNEVDL